MVRFRDAVRSGRAVMPQNIDRKMREKILLQGARLPYHFAEAGGLKYVMEKKEEMRKQGIKSPDIIDAMSFPFLEDATSYMVSADAMVGGVDSVAAAAQNKADDLFAGV
ncbi:hypothetical protein ABD07_04590 [Nitrosomonas oligotropha]|nr:hypothetical protein [Nitrosomonas oligotropha]